jgi:hypothetical protein
MSHKLTVTVFIFWKSPIYSSNADFLTYWTSGVSEKVRFSLNSSSRYCHTHAFIKFCSNVLHCFSVALRDIFTTIESVFSALLVTIFVLPVRGIFSVSPHILQRFKSLENVDLFIFKLCATWLARCLSSRCRLTRWSVKSVTRTRTRTRNWRKCAEPEIFYCWYLL